MASTKEYLDFVLEIFLRAVYRYWRYYQADFTRIGIPFTLAAVVGGYLFFWCVWR